MVSRAPNRKASPMDEAQWEDYEVDALHFRGSWQRDIARHLVTGVSVYNPISNLKGEAKRWSGRYLASWHKVLLRMAALGYDIRRTSGKRGGEWGAQYRVTNGRVSR